MLRLGIKILLSTAELCCASLNSIVRCKCCAALQKKIFLTLRCAPEKKMLILHCAFSGCKNRCALFRRAFRKAVFVPISGSFLLRC